MNFWLVGLGLALVCTVSAEPECSADSSKMWGKWYVTGMATNCEHFLKHKNMMKIVVADVSVKTDSTLHILTNLPKKDGCKRMEMDFQKLDDGTYYHKSDWGSANQMKVVATDCEAYVIVRAQIEHKGKSSNHLSLYTRSSETTPEHREKFLEIAKKLGYTMDQIVFPQEVACVQQ